VSVLLALALAAAPGCPAVLAEAASLDDGRLAAEAPRLVAALEAAGDGPVEALRLALRGGAAASGLRPALERHCALARAPARPADPGDDAALRAILARPEYRRAADPLALRRALLALENRLLELLGSSEAGRYAVVGRTIFLGAAAVALGLLAGAALRRRARRVPAAASSRRTDVADAGERVADAEAALGRGDAREAVRLALLAALAALERGGSVPRGRALTNGELVGALAGPGGGADLAPELAALAAVFDRTFYGGRPVALEDARDAVARARRVARAERTP
jgi:hypothetical protein